MRFIADLHIHSHFSIATSKKLMPEYLDQWARIKGINVVGSGDCVHPGWFAELKEKLSDNGNGLYSLKDSYRLKDFFYPGKENNPPKIQFILSGEISSIYKKNGKVRKVHSICVFPDFQTLEKFQARLKKIGNITSDGRPILGLDAKNLLEIMLESGKESPRDFAPFLIPAHIWTPWFSVLGSKSGFDSIAECYDDLVHHIFALETGLSSDPEMNRMCSFLDKYRLVSNSDAHSPEKLGREANIFDTELSYPGILKALRDDLGFFGTIEFFPQEGKYHYDGHRKCSISWDPLTTIRNKGICPVCGKEVTKGVLYRVMELADRTELSESQRKKPFYSVTPLPEILSEILNQKNPASKNVQREYFRTLESLGSEFDILLFQNLDEIKSKGGELLSEGIRRLRQGKVHIQEGYDGEFGRIKVFAPGEMEILRRGNLFSSAKPQNAESIQVRKGKDASSGSEIGADFSGFKNLHHALESDLDFSGKNPNEKEIADQGVGKEFLELQQEILENLSGVCAVISGPGSGKTWLLTEKIKLMAVEEHNAGMGILVLVFSNHAAREIRQRLKLEWNNSLLSIHTFHSFGLGILREHHDLVMRSPDFTLLDEEDKSLILENYPGFSGKTAKKIARQISQYKQGQVFTLDENFRAAMDYYSMELKKMDAFDLDDLIALPLDLMDKFPELRNSYQQKYPQILVDEFQDINKSQYDLLNILLDSENPHLFVIGDPDQAIYGFRGSESRYLEDLRKRFPQLKYFSLGHSYRVPLPILKAGGQVLKKGSFMQGREISDKIIVRESASDAAEADWIAATVEKMVGGVRSFSLASGMADGSIGEHGYSLSDFCILCRTFSMFEPIRVALDNHGIPYQLIGMRPFYFHEPFLSLIRLFKSAYYQLGDFSKSKGAQIIVKNKINNIQAILDLLKNQSTLQAIFAYLSSVKKISTEEWKQLDEFITPYENRYREFLRDLSLKQGIDDFDYQRQSVSLMTIHAAKGLEFANVFIPGCEKGILPLDIFHKLSESELREEERLFYVGLTRTRNSLFLSYAKKRLWRGSYRQLKKSPFLEAIERDLLQMEQRAGKKNSAVYRNQPELFSDIKTPK